MMTRPRAWRLRHRSAQRSKTCRFPASSFHNGEHLLGCKEGMGHSSLSPSVNLPLPFQDSPVSRLLGQSGLGLTHQGTFLLLDFVFCPYECSVLCLSSVAPPNVRLPPSGGRTAFTALFFGLSSTVHRALRAFFPVSLWDLSDRLCRAVCATTRRVLLGSCSILADRAARALVAMGLNEFAFVLIVRLPTFSIFADRFIRGFPLDYGPILLLMPSDPACTADALPSLPVSLTFRPARLLHQPFGYDVSSFRLQREL